MLEDSHGYGWEGLAPVPISQVCLWGGRAINPALLQGNRVSCSVQTSVLSYSASQFVVQSPFTINGERDASATFFCLCIKISHRLDESVWSCSLGWGEAVFLQCLFFSIGYKDYTGCVTMVQTFTLQLSSTQPIFASQNWNFLVWRMPVFSYVLSHQ